MPGPGARPFVPVVVGAVVALLYLVVALTCLFASSSPQDLLTETPADTRLVRFAPYAVLATGLLVGGLVLGPRRWATPLAPLVVAVAAWWWLTWLVDLPRHIAENDWTGEHAADVADTVGTAWEVVTMAAVVVGWSLVRRRGWRWALGLVPAALLVAVAVVVGRAAGPDDSDGTARNVDEAVRRLSQEVRVDGTITIVLGTLAVVGGVWLCVLAERQTTRRLGPDPAGPVRG